MKGTLIVACQKLIDALAEFSTTRRYVVLSVSSTMNLHPVISLYARLEFHECWYHIFVIDCSIKRAWMPQNLGCDFRSLSQHEVCCDF
ncbi:hypothetical protein WN944_005765 [Citrus x changshan-huyou]|uniref:Uncharacterized protein n=1 Tax=Citrus x changshan-huyou TaxID=2935761 RepID=A0AAP0QSW0_9ROSI